MEGQVQRKITRKEDVVRFLAAGCSCTRHCWPTWADYISTLFKTEDYYNLGVPGGDNANIARTVIETAKPGDLVIVQWTGLDRFNKFSNNVVQPLRGDNDKALLKSCGMTPEDNSGGWITTGCIMSDKDFFVNHYHPMERFRTTLDYVKMVEMHSKLVGYQVFNFSMTLWFQGETEKTIDSRFVEMHQQCNFNHFYLKNNLEDLRRQTLNIKITHKYAEGDVHPTPVVHYKWAKEYIAPEVGLHLPDLDAKVTVDQKRVLAGDVD